MKKSTLTLNQKLDLIDQKFNSYTKYLSLGEIVNFCEEQLKTDEDWESYIDELVIEAQTGIGWPEMGIAERRAMMQLTPEQKINAFGRAKRLWE